MKIKFLSIALLLFTLLSPPSYSAGIDSDEKLSIELENVSVSTAVNMIAKQYNLNIVISGDISANVSLRLNNVKLSTALDAILLPNGYNYYTENGVIIVKSKKTRAVGEFVSKVIRLDYIDPFTARKALLTRKSEHGEVVILDKSADGITNKKYKPNKIFISDFPQVVSTMEAIIKDIDKEEKLISIQVRIIEIILDKDSKLGFNWPSSITSGLQSINNVSTGTSTTSSVPGNRFALSKDLNSGSWNWGTLSVAELQTVLDLLDQTKNSKLISDPRITTLENHEAEIKILTIIPIPTINRFSEAATTTDILTFQDEEVGITLRVTPRLNSHGQITMEVHPSVQDIIGFSGPVENQKPITSERSIRTIVTVKDGETAVLGGLLKESEIKSVKKIPLLGSIPFLGKLLFTSTSVETRTTDLIILITPKVL